jgi:RimJ/RimL family protein N-acetyltransferase
MYKSLKLKSQEFIQSISIIEKYFPIRFTRKTFLSEKIELFFCKKVNWFKFKSEIVSVGMVFNKKQHWHVAYIVTEENHRRHHYAEKILKRIIRKAKKTETEYITTNIREGNEKSIKLFTKLGFKHSKIQDKAGFTKYIYIF